MKALTFSKFGGPEVLEYRDVETPVLKQGEVLVKMEAIGLNYADIYRRKGNYHLKGNPPFIAGYEGAGIVADNGSLSEYKVGDRVAFADVPFANAEYVAVSADHIIRLPDYIITKIAASVLLQGLTAHYLSHDSHPVKQGEIVLIHAASGGVGQILTQLCKLAGATVIGLTTSVAKFGIIKNSGADAFFNLNANWKEQVSEFTGGKGVDVVYDSIGSTLMDSLEMSKTCGHVVFYGMSGGDPAFIDPRMLMDSSKTLSGGDLWSYLTSFEERNRRASYLFNLIHAGKLNISEPVAFPLEKGADAHRFLESGKSAGKVLLIP